MMTRRSRSPGTEGHRTRSQTPSSMSTATRRIPPPDLGTVQPLIPNMVMDPRRPAEVRVDETTREPDYSGGSGIGAVPASASQGDERTRVGETRAETEARSSAERVDIPPDPESTERAEAVPREDRSQEGGPLREVPRPRSLPNPLLDLDDEVRPASERVAPSVTSRSSGRDGASIPVQLGIPPLPSTPCLSERESQRPGGTLFQGVLTPSARSAADSRSDQRESRLEGMIQNMAQAISTLGDRLQDIEERRSIRSRQSSRSSVDSSLLRARVRNIQLTQASGGLSTPADNQSSLAQATNL